MESDREPVSAKTSDLDVSKGSEQSLAHNDQELADYPQINQLEEGPVVAEKADDDEDGALDGKGKGLIALVMLALSLAVFLAALDTTIVTTALPAIAEHFQSAAGYTWIGSAYLLGNAASSPLWGKLSDIFGRKPVLLAANLVFFIGSLIAALSVSIGMLITARAIQGVGGAGLLVLVDIAISDLFSLRTRGAYLGVIGGVWAFSCALGPVVGGVLTTKVNWRWCFYINLPLDGLAFLIIIFFIHLKTPKVPFLDGLRAIDWLGTLFVLGGTIMLLMGLQWGGVTYPWNSPTVICLIVFGVVSTVLFILVEWKVAKYALIQLSIFKNPSTAGSLIFTFLHAFVFIALFYYLPLYFQAVRGDSPLQSGIYVLPATVAAGLAAVAAGAFMGITGWYLPPIYVGALLMTLGFGLFIDLGPNTGWAKLIIYQLIAGTGVGPNFLAPLVALQSGIKSRDIASSTASFNFFRQVANAIGVVVGQVVFQNQMTKKQGQLVAALGPQLAAQLSGSDVASNTEFINSLPGPAQDVARSAFASSLRPMWIMYTCFSAAALLSALLIRSKTLSTEHEIQEVGLEAEKRHAAERKAERDARGIR